MKAVSSSETNRLKRAAATRAVEEVEDGMVLGLGSGSTAAFALEALAKRIGEGLRITGIPSSEKTANIARQLKIPLTDFNIHPRIDLAIDGADQVERSTLNLIKGLGGALLREKIVAAASKHMIVIVDRSKLVERLGLLTPLPVEIIPFGWQSTFEKLSELGCKPILRVADKLPFVTDEGNYIADCGVSDIADPELLERQLADTVGVVESGLFIGLAKTVIVGGSHGVEVIRK